LRPQLEISQRVVEVGLQILARPAKFVNAVDFRFGGSDGRKERCKQTLPRLGLMTAWADRAGGKAAYVIWSSNVVWSSHGFAPSRSDMSPTRRAISSGVMSPFSTTSVEMPTAHLSK